MFKSKLTTDDKNNLLQWAIEGAGHTEIVNRLDNKISKQRVKQICAANGIDAFAIKQEVSSQANEEKMVSKWGIDWKNKEHRRSYIYQVMRQKFRVKKYNAQKKGKEWTIEFGDLEFPTHCPILNIELDYFCEQASDNSPSFDCLDPKKGYVKGNVFVISWRANRIKNDGTAKEHLAIASFMKLSGEF